MRGLLGAGQGGMTGVGQTDRLLGTAAVCWCAALADMTSCCWFAALADMTSCCWQPHVGSASVRLAGTRQAAVMLWQAASSLLSRTDQLSLQQLFLLLPKGLSLHLPSCRSWLLWQRTTRRL